MSTFRRLVEYSHDGPKERFLLAAVHSLLGKKLIGVANMGVIRSGQWVIPKVVLKGWSYYGNLVVVVSREGGKSSEPDYSPVSAWDNTEYATTLLKATDNPFRAKALRLFGDHSNEPEEPLESIRSFVEAADSKEDERWYEFAQRAAETLKGRELKVLQTFDRHIQPGDRVVIVDPNIGDPPWEWWNFYCAIRVISSLGHSSVSREDVASIETLLIRTDNPFRTKAIRLNQARAPERFPDRQNEPEEPFESIQESSTWHRVAELSDRFAQQYMGKLLEFNPDAEIPLDWDDSILGDRDLATKSLGRLVGEGASVRLVATTPAFPKDAQLVYLPYRGDPVRFQLDLAMLCMATKNIFAPAMRREWDRVHQGNEPELSLESIQEAEGAPGRRYLQALVGKRLKVGKGGLEVFVPKRTGSWIGYDTPVVTVPAGEEIEVLEYREAAVMFGVVVRLPNGRKGRTSVWRLLNGTLNPFRQKFLQAIRQTVEPEEPLA